MSRRALALPSSLLPLLTAIPLAAMLAVGCGGDGTIPEAGIDLMDSGPGDRDGGGADDGGGTADGDVPYIGFRLVRITDLSTDTTTGEVHRRHHVSPDGFYRGKQVIEARDE